MERNGFNSNDFGAGMEIWTHEICFNESNMSIWSWFSPVDFPSTLMVALKFLFIYDGEFAANTNLS